MFEELQRVSTKIGLPQKAIEQMMLEISLRDHITNESVRRDYWAKFTSDMDHHLYGAQKKVWKMLKNRKGVTKDVWEKYFGKLYNTKGAISIENYETNHQITLNEEEVMAKIKKLNKTEKLPGQTSSQTNF